MPNDECFRPKAQYWLLSANSSGRPDPVLLRLRPVGTCFLGRKNGVQRISFLTRPELHDAIIANIFNQPFQNLAAKVSARHFPATEENCSFDLVSVLQKP